MEDRACLVELTQLQCASCCTVKVAQLHLRLLWTNAGVYLGVHTHISTGGLAGGLQLRAELGMGRVNRRLALAPARTSDGAACAHSIERGGPGPAEIPEASPRADTRSPAGIWS